MPPEIITDEAKRIFTVDGIVYPSVTFILKEMGFLSNPFYTEQGAENGSRRHTIRHLNDIDDLVEDSVDPDDMPYLEAWRELKGLSGITVVESEVRRYNHVHKYCGKPDTLVLFKGRKEVWDVKTGKPELWHRWQLGGYIGLYDNVFHGRCVYLQANGKFKLGDVYGRKEREDFLTINKTYQLRRECNGRD